MLVDLISGDLSTPAMARPKEPFYLVPLPAQERRTRLIPLLLLTDLRACKDIGTSAYKMI